MLGRAVAVSSHEDVHAALVRDAASPERAPLWRLPLGQPLGTAKRRAAMRGIGGVVLSCRSENDQVRVLGLNRLGIPLKGGHSIFHSLLRTSKSCA